MNFLTDFDRCHEPPVFSQLAFTNAVNLKSRAVVVILVLGFIANVSPCMAQSQEGKNQSSVEYVQTSPDHALSSVIPLVPAQSFGPETAAEIAAVKQSGMSSRAITTTEYLLVSTFRSDGQPLLCCIGAGVTSPTLLAHAFVVPATQDMTFTGASVYLWSNQPGLATSVDISLFNDISGHPGDTLETFHINAALDPSNAAPIRVTSQLNPLLVRGNLYWLVVSTPPGTNIAWNYGSVSSSPDDWASSPALFFGWNRIPYASFDGAFRIYATAATADVVALSPKFGLGTSGTFKAVFRHSGGQKQHYLGYILFLPLPNIVSFNARGTCLIEFNRLGGNFDGNGGMRLIDDSGTAWLGPVQGVPRAPNVASLSNSACTVNVAETTVQFSETEMVLNVPVTFKSSAVTPMMGTFLQSLDVRGQWSDFRQFGNWTVPGATQKPGVYVTAASPTTGVGTTVTLTAMTGHTSGAGQISAVHIRFNSSIGGGLPCHAVYFAGTDMIGLISDDQSTVVGPVPLGNTVSMSRCSIVPGASRVISGNDLRLTIPFSFETSTFGGRKSIYIDAFDINGGVSHWVETGSWKVE